MISKMCGASGKRLRRKFESALALAQPDGYTLLGGVSSVTINPAFKKDIPYGNCKENQDRHAGKRGQDQKE